MTAAEIFPYATLPKITIRVCPVCDTPTPRVIPQRDRYGYDIAMAFCPTCHLGYHAQQLTREGYARLYNGSYRALVESVAPNGSSPYSAQCRIGQGLRPVLTSRIPAGGHLLDAGGSTGALIPALGLTPKSVTVLDASAAEVESCRGVRTICGWLEDPIPGRYDGVVCMETMDHVTRPVTVLRNLRASCPDGWLLADYCLPPHFKIDHPLYWHPDAWTTALRQSHWTPVYEGAYRIAAYPHHFSLCH